MLAPTDRRLLLSVLCAARGIHARPGRGNDLHVGPPGTATRSARRDDAPVGRRPRGADRESVCTPDCAATKREQDVAVLSRGRDQDSRPARRAAHLPRGGRASGIPATLRGVPSEDMAAALPGGGRRRARCTSAPRALPKSHVRPLLGRRPVARRRGCRQTARLLVQPSVERLHRRVAADGGGGRSGAERPREASHRACGGRGAARRVGAT